MKLHPPKPKIENPKVFLAIFVFYTIALVCRYITNKTSLFEGINNPFFPTVLQGAGPAIGAWVAVIWFKIPFRMNLKGNYRNIAIPIALYWIFPIILIVGTAYFVKGTFPIASVFIILVYGLLEEIGWRGFLQPLLSPLPKLVSIFIIAILWFIWHLNFEISAANIMFFIILLFGSWGIGVVAEKTNSLLAVAAFHSLNNFFSTLDYKGSMILLILIVFWIMNIVSLNRK